MINLSQQMTSLLYFVAFILCSVLEAASHPFIVILFEAVDLFALLKRRFRALTNVADDMNTV